MLRRDNSWSVQGDEKRGLHSRYLALAPLLSGLADFRRPEHLGPNEDRFPFIDVNPQVSPSFCC